ncbi:ECF transporter S component [Auraticoccus monumenti]|uniref:Energy-coupling factor transport system substrate-specific component n=1 Tax=Auraticoccus monumenti TaxID=675864 RepID=A0A1G6XE08_9ACTN|nr:ECF transporter S component [Auraticoccus monumenti]SDD76003.1 energy-coupling factor transport system substrate-specific component [Auraticoccus monumenti]
MAGSAASRLDPSLPVVEVGAAPVGVRLHGWSAVVVAVASVLALSVFLWPLWLPADAGGQRGDAPWLLALLLPALVLLTLAQLGERGLDSRTLAVLGVLSALNAALRPTLSAGTAGVESVFFTLVLAGRVFGPGFGFLLGCTSLFASALLTAGVGPWLPFQMVCAAWIGMGAGLLPRRLRGRRELAVLVVYGIVSAYAFGLLMNLWFWPFVTSTGGAATPGALDYLPGAPVLENLRRFAVFTLITSTGGWDTGRAVTNTVALLVLGPPVLAVLRRAARLP